MSFSHALPPHVSVEEAGELMEQLRQEGPIIGTDEAGRGPLAGPVVAAAVWLTPEQERALLALGLRDSKRMTPRSREKVFQAMKNLGVLWQAQAGSVARIDRDNILRASLWAMGRSVTRLAEPMGRQMARAMEALSGGTLRCTVSGACPGGTATVP